MSWLYQWLTRGNIEWNKACAKDMVVNRLKILCPLLVDIREHQRFGRSTMKSSSAAIIRLDKELTAFLSQADLMIVHQIVQLGHDWQQISARETEIKYRWQDSPLPRNSCVLRPIGRWDRIASANSLLLSVRVEVIEQTSQTSFKSPRSHFLHCYIRTSKLLFL